jgi:hypothetical protein
VFHVNLLRPIGPKSEYLPGQQVQPPAPVKVDEEEEYFVERVEDLRYNRRQKQHEYLVK